MDLQVHVILWLSAFVLYLWWRFSPSKKKGPKNLPPGPPGWPIVGNLIQVILQKRHFTFQVSDLRAKYGPIFTMRLGQRTVIVVTSSELIHEALVKKGPLFDSRPPDSPIRLIFSIHKCTINSAKYGQFWQALRRNLLTELLNPRRIKQNSWVRRIAIENHLDRLKNESADRGFVEVISNASQTLYTILIYLCFGTKLSDEKIKEIECVLKDVIQIADPKLPDFFPVLLPLFRRQVKAAKQLRKKQMECLLPLVRNRRAFIESGGKSSASSYEMVNPIGAAYIDSLFCLDAPGRGPLGEEELITLCTEIIVGGTDTTSTSVEWALLHLVLDQNIQEKLYQEIVATVGENGTLTEEAIENMPYLGAFVKETFRRHPPSHFLFSHATLKDTELGGYTIPSYATVEFYSKLITEDTNIWEDPGEFRPERFLTGDGVDADLTGKRGVKMMPFGAGRRICPAATLGTLHIQLLIAQMVQKYKWNTIPGNPPNIAEAVNLSVKMKDPLKAIIVSRS